MSWTAAELDALRDLAGQGLSASQIAARLPGARSRNAVIGMLKRGNGKYGQLLGQPRNEARGRAPSQPKPAQPKRVRSMAQAPIRPVRQILAKAPPIEAVANLPAPLPITFLAAVMADRCLHYACDWFASDGPDMPVCGAERARNVLETRYCRRHLVSQRQLGGVAA
ncbi:hypothetical protein FJ872_19555 [Mesorhizobium sp. B2-5-9]|uniref:GcrA family cell cycle regulator n=1 Tax=Mesorhizobium sp. B2-5-9 TaxID=2589921 RepID=UPI0011282283|nr:GcrA family cell cycle regulator [Mesorhizobium sp. B2-5-9]TPK15194.1 hypothetical protein FJ872_19555 [Mesorhizobium sp. B2-5-9]